MQDFSPPEPCSYLRAGQVKSFCQSLHFDPLYNQRSIIIACCMHQQGTEEGDAANEFCVRQVFCGNQRVNRMESSAAEHWLVEIQVQVYTRRSHLGSAGDSYEPMRHYRYEECLTGQYHMV